MAKKPVTGVTVLMLKDAGGVGSFWEREFWLARASNGGYSVGCEQTVIYKEDRVRIPTQSGLVNGEDVWYALAGMVGSIGAYSIDDCDLDEIVTDVAKLDAALAQEVRAAAMD